MSWIWLLHGHHNPWEIAVGAAVAVTTVIWRAWHDNDEESEQGDETETEDCNEGRRDDDDRE